MLTYGPPTRIERRGKLTKRFYSRTYDDTTGKRSWRNTGKEGFDAARRQIRTWELADAAGVKPDQDVPVGFAVDQWILKKSGEMSTGWSSYDGRARKWKAFFGEKTLVRSVGPAQVERYLRERLLEVGTSTRNKELAGLRQFFNWCSTPPRHWCTENPTATTQRLTEPRRQIRVLSLEEETRLLEACETPYKIAQKGKRNSGARKGGQTTAPRLWTQEYKPPAWLKPLVQLLLRTGLRLGTVRQLEWSDIDFTQRMIRVPAEKMKAREELVLPFGEEVEVLLKNLRKDASTMKVLELPDPGNLERAYQNALERAKLPPTRLHDMRSTFISRYRKAGIDIEIVARLVGHRNISTTLKYYRKIEDTDLRAAVDKVNAAATPASPKGRSEAKEGGA